MRASRQGLSIISALLSIYIELAMHKTDRGFFLLQKTTTSAAAAAVAAGHYMYAAEARAATKHAQFAPGKFFP
jgi:putative N-acetylmannosamine-6-phosphate epimerase